MDICSFFVTDFRKIVRKGNVKYSIHQIKHFFSFSYYYIFIIFAESKALKNLIIHNLSDKAMSKRLFSLLVLALILTTGSVVNAQRHRYNFNLDWNMLVADWDSAQFFSSQDVARAKSVPVTLPHAWNEDDAYRLDIHSHRDSISWYYKTFRLPADAQGKHVFIEFEGARQCADVWLNGHKVGCSENGVMAFGFDLTPYLQEGDNQLAVRCDNDWDYRERGTNVKYQWNNRNFNMNMGGLPKNVWLHVTGDVYQTLPLYSNLGTTGTYIYGSNYDIKGHKVTVNAEAQVINATDKAVKASLRVQVLDAEGKQVAQYNGAGIQVAAGDTTILSASKRLSGMHFWSWGYGYLYTVKTDVMIGGKSVDQVQTRTGFRKTDFGEGKIWLNDRCMMVHGYAQRTSNEWPSVGIDLPAWLSDYSNDLVVQSGGNVMRWMHVTPIKQDVESCDRVGLMHAMPAGDAEKDCNGRQWSQRKELMRDAIIYNRNNPSIIFYECGNESISREHMVEMKEIRDAFDPHGGRAIGSREMLDINEAEYGGEMLYLNKSGKHPMWAMEYCRDEGYRLYWDNYSYPWHQAGAGPYYRNAPANDYNRNQDDLAIEHIKRWHDYYVLRPGMGRRVSSGGVKIIFSDTNTHNRSEFNYRTSGVTDAMRIPKDSYFAHQVMWDSWVDVQHHRSHILGHWNYAAGVRKNIYVISTSPIVELFVNGKSVGRSEKAEYTFLHTIKNVEFQPGVIKAVGYAADGVTVESEAQHETAGRPDHLQLTLMQNPGGMKADGSDLALIQVEVMDKEGRRCPVDNRLIRWSLKGDGEWRGGIAKSPNLDNYILSTEVPVECGVGRVLVRSKRLTEGQGHIELVASATGMEDASLSWTTTAIDDENGLSTYQAGMEQPLRLGRGETPLTPSFTEKKVTYNIASVEAGANGESAANSYDDNELSEWRNDGRLSTAWITYTLTEPAAIDEISLKLTGWRQRSYPVEVFADGKLVWKGNTPKSLGYVSLEIENPVEAKTYTIRQIGSASDKDEFGQITELAGGPATELDLYKSAGGDKVKGELRIVEIDFLKKL